MFLDLYQRDMATSLQPQPNEAHDLPATGEAAFGAAWGEARLFSQSIAGANARASVLQDYLAEIRQKTGNDLSQEFIPDAAGGGQLGVMDFHSINDRVAKMKENYPDLALNPLSDAEIEARAIAKSRAARTAYQTMADREKTFGGSLGFFAGGVAGAAADPVNIVALPVAPAAELGLLSTALRWGGIAAVSQAGIEGIGAPFREQVQPEYSASGEPITNVLEAAVGGAVLGGGMKALGNIWTRAKTGTWPRSVRDAGNIAESEANVANTNPYPGVAGEVAHRTALQNSIDAMVSGRPVDVEQQITPSILASYEQRLAPIMDARARAAASQESAFALEREGARLPNTMERLTEQHLGEFRNAADAARADGATATAGLVERQKALLEARGPLVERAQALDAQRTEIDNLRASVDVANQRFADVPPHIDPVTQSRLDAIEWDLAKPALSADARVALQAERQTITESIAAGPSADQLARQRASLEQEAKGLAKALSAKQKAFERATAKHAKEIAALEKQQSAAEAQAAAVSPRAATRIEAAQTGLRKTINKLAHDGYGVQLPRAEAEAMAEKVISASDREAADQAIRDVTETLVDRRMQAQRGKPLELPFGEPNPVAQKTAEANYHTEQMRKQITALAREVGYQMPREEAAAIAAKVAGLPEREALAVLDELMLRPRTLAETLPTSAMGETYTGVTKDGAAIVADFTRMPPDLAAALDHEFQPATIEKTLSSPEHVDAMINDLDKLRMTSDKQIPVGVDENGQPIMKSLDAMVEEVKADREAATHLEACITPQQEAAE